MRHKIKRQLLWFWLALWLYLSAASALAAQDSGLLESGPQTSGAGALAGTDLQSAAALLQETTQRLQQGQYQAAQAAVGNYLLLYPEHYRVPEANFYQAIATYHLGQPEQARSEFNALLAANPEETRRFGVFYWLGLCAYRLGNNDTAYDLWLRQLAVREADAADYLQQTYFALGQVLAERGDAPLALRYFRLLEGRVKSRAGFAYGTLALRQGLYQEAYNAFSSYLIQKDIENGPSRAQALFYQGQSAFFAALLPQAKQSLDTVLRLYQSNERLFQAALMIRLRIAVKEGDVDTAGRFYDEAVTLLQRYRYGLEDWLRASELELFLLQGYQPLALKHMRARLARSRGRTEREIAKFNLALVKTFLDVRNAIRQLEKLRESFIPEIRERALFQAARLQVSFPLTRSVGLEEMEAYLSQYPDGFYVQEAIRILLQIYRSDPERYWLAASVLLDKLVKDLQWPARERARFYLYWAEMARQLGNETASLSYLFQSWKLAPKDLVGLQAYYRSGANYFAQKQYSRALGYFREVDLQLSDMKFRNPIIKGEAEELKFYAKLGIAQGYAGAGQTREALRQFQQLIAYSRDAQLGRSVQQAQLQLGLVYFYQKAYEQAVNTFDLIISQGIYPSNQPDIPPDQYTPALMALYWKGEALLRQGLFAAARQSFRRVNEIYPEALGASAYMRAALAAKAGEDYASVVEDLQRAQGFVQGKLLQLLNVDFNLVKYNLLLGRDPAALAAAEHMLEAVPPAYNLLGEAFMEVSELYFNRGDLARSTEILSLLEREFIRKLPPRERREERRLELYLQEQNQGTPYAGGMVMDAALNANLKDRLFSFDAERFLQRYSRTMSSAIATEQGSNTAALDKNMAFYISGSNSELAENDTLSTSIFSALYLLGIIYAQQEDYLNACKYFLQYLHKDRLGPYAVSAVSSALRLIPELNVSRNRQLYRLLKSYRLGDALESVLFVRYWSLQADRPNKKRALERIIRKTLSINARKEAMYHLAEYFRKQGNKERWQQLLQDLRAIVGGNLALDPDNYWAGLANLELGREAYQGGNFGEAKVYFQSIVDQAQVERETLAEALFWLTDIAHFEGNFKEESRYRESLQELAPDSEWLRKLD